MAINDGGEGLGGGGDREDVESGAGLNSNGLSAEDQAIFDQMQAADDDPGAGGDDHGEGGEVVTEDAGAGGDVEKAAPGKVVEHDDDDEEEEADAGQQAGRKRKRVTLSKFEREVGARDKELKELRDQLAQRDEERGRIQERLEIINQALTNKGKPEQEEPGDDDPEPDPEADIYAHNKWLKRRYEGVVQRLEQFEERGQQQEAQNMVRDAYESDFVTYARTEPNLPAAYEHLMNSRIAELAEFHFGKDVTAEGVMLTREELGKINRVIVREEQQLVSKALKAGQSPAAQMFRLAKHRGFVPAAPKPQQDAKVVNGKGNGNAAPGSLAEQAEALERGGGGANGNGKSTVRQEIERAKAGAEAALSLSGGGGAPKTALTIERIANMSGQEFEAMMNSLSEEELAVVMGGEAL